MRRLVSVPALVIAGLLLLQVAWIATIPPFRGSDEIDHAYRAAAVARGDWRVGETAENGRGQLVDVPESLVRAANAQCESLEYMGPDNCSPVEATSDGGVLVATAAGPYHPAFYWAVGAVALPFEGAAALYAMRIVAALLCLLFLGLGAWAINQLPGRWPMAAYVLAATPVLVYSTTVVAPNGLEMGAALSLWAALLALVGGVPERTEKRLLWVAIASAVALGTLRALGPIFILLILATMVIFDGRGLWSVIRRQLSRFTVGIVLVGASVAGQAAWLLSATGGDGGSAAPEGPTEFKPSNLIVWPLQTVAAFPLRNEPGAIVVYPVVIAMVAILIIAGVHFSRGWQRCGLLLAVGVALGLPVVLTLATLSTIGDVWQGRYGLPYAVGFVLIAGCVVGRCFGARPLPILLTLPAGLGYGVAIAACLVKIRNEELSTSQASSGDPAWLAPVPPILVVIVALAMILFALALMDSRPHGHSQSSSQGMFEVAPGRTPVAGTEGGGEQQRGMQSRGDAHA